MSQPIKVVDVVVHVNIVVVVYVIVVALDQRNLPLSLVKVRSVTAEILLLLFSKP